MLIYKDIKQSSKLKFEQREDTMKFLHRNKDLLNTNKFSESDYYVLSYEELLKVNGRGSTPSGGTTGPTGPTGGGYGTCAGGGAITSGNGSGSSSSGGSQNNNSQIQTTVNYSKASYALVEGVGFVTESIQQGCYTDKNNKLTVSNMAAFSGANNTSSVDNYTFYGNVTLIIDGYEVETKTITAPSGSNVWDGTYDYIGNVTFDTPIPTYGSVEIKSDIDMLINHASVNFATNTSKLR